MSKQAYCNKITYAHAPTLARASTDGTGVGSKPAESAGRSTCTDRCGNAALMLSVCAKLGGVAFVPMVLNAGFTEPYRQQPKSFRL